MAPSRARCRKRRRQDAASSPPESLIPSTQKPPRTRLFKRVETPDMPEPGSTVRALQEQAVANADLFLTSSYGALRLAKSEFVAEAKCFRAGWSLLIQPSSRERELHLYLDSSFPFSRPAFFLRDRPEFLTWPHIENSGKLCLLDDIKITHPEH